MISLEITPRHLFKLAFTSRFQTTGRPAACLLAMVLVWGTVVAWSQSTGKQAGVAETPASTPPSSPEVVIAVTAAPLVQVTEMKYRVFFNKMEAKGIPLIDFDSAAIVSDELITALAGNNRVRWRQAKPQEKEQLASFFGPNTWKQQSFPPPSLEADRVLMVGVGYGAFVHAVRKDLDMSVALRLMERKTGKILWKKIVSQRMRLPGKLEELQADNQRPLKEALNKLIEQIMPKVKKEISERRI